jgi:hypothetical protein
MFNNPLPLFLKIGTKNASLSLIGHLVWSKDKVEQLSEPNYCLSPRLLHASIAIMLGIRTKGPVKITLRRQVPPCAPEALHLLKRHRELRRLIRNDGEAFVGFLFIFIMDHLINHLGFLFMCFTMQRSLGQRLRLKLTDAHDGGMAKGDCRWRSYGAGQVEGNPGLQKFRV